MVIGMAGTAGTLVHGFPIGIAIAFWGFAGLGMGISYNTNSVLAIQAVTEHSAANRQLFHAADGFPGTGAGREWEGWF